MKRYGLLLAILMLFAACDSPDMNTSVQENLRSSEVPPPPGKGGLVAEYSIADAKVMMRESNQEQKIIRSASLRYEVNDMEKALTDINALLERYKGEVQNEHRYSQPERLNSNLVLRIPAKQFDNFIADLLKGENIRRLEERNISARDVTEQFIDVETRLKTKKQTMERYQELLQKAQTVSDIINVEDKIRRLQEEIESQEARLKYLSTQVEMSEVRIDIYEVIKTGYVPERSTGFLSILLRSLHDGLNGMIVVFFWIVRLWPLWLIFLVLAFRKKFTRNKDR
ncbi:MAG: DUF4349 domain-containing protein [Candidatus Neomarinimicrobiota bacterium]|jgi:hypothetical protein